MNRKPVCGFCGEPVDTNRAGYFILVQGWAEQRGSEGGTNALKRKEVLGPVAHGYCLKYGQQPPLFKELHQEAFPLAEIKKERFA